MPQNCACQHSRMCDCAEEIDRRRKKGKKASHSAQTDEVAGLDLSAFFSNMFEGVGPWVPYIGGATLFIMLLGFVSKNVDKLLGMFDYEYEEKPSYAPAPLPAGIPVTSEPPDPCAGTGAGACKRKCSMRVDANRIRWP